MSAVGDGTFRAGTTNVEAKVSGSLSGTARHTLDLSLGIESSGRVFITEGSNWNGTLSADGNLTGSATTGNTVNGTLTASGHLDGSVKVVLDDGDQDHGERLYFLTADLTNALTSHDSLTIAATLNLDNLQLSVSVPALRDIIPTLILEGSGIWDLSEATSEFELHEDSILDQLAVHVAAKINQFVERAGSLADQAVRIPVVGAKIASTLRSQINTALTIHLPDQGIREYLTSRGFIVEKMVSVESLLSGNLTDLITIRYQSDFTTTPVRITGAGTLGDSAGVHLDVTGAVVVQPKLTIDVGLGFDLSGGFYLEEGSVISATLIVDGATANGALSATAHIPHLADIATTVRAPDSQHLVEAHLDLSVSDFDQFENERLYLFGDADALMNLLTDTRAVNLYGNASFEAELS